MQKQKAGTNPIKNLRTNLCPQQAFPASSLVCDKAGAYPSEAPFKCSTLGQAPGLAHEHSTRLERLAKDKHSSLLRKSVNYVRKKFYRIGACFGMRCFTLY